LNKLMNKFHECLAKRRTLFRRGFFALIYRPRSRQFGRGFASIVPMIRATRSVEPGSPICRRA
jgi:hypothetical protein